MSKIKVIVKRPDEEFGHMTRISETMENLQKTVGGYIETVTICTNTVVICNEEGLLRQLPYNCAVLNEERFAEFLGTIIVAGVTGDYFRMNFPGDITLDELRAMDNTVGFTTEELVTIARGAWE